MEIRSGREDDVVLLAEQRALGSALQRLGRALLVRQGVDPGLATETVVTVLTSIRTWLESGMILSAVDAAALDQLEKWEEELAADEAYLAAARKEVQAGLSMTLRQRNEQRGATSYSDQTANDSTD
jgi:hypothetical protein